MAQKEKKKSASFTLFLSLLATRFSIPATLLHPLSIPAILDPTMVDKLSGLRGVGDAVFKDALLAADPEEAVHRHLRVRGEWLKAGDVDYLLSQFDRVFVVGAGKAAGRMAMAVERILQDRLTGGIVIGARGPAITLRRALLRHGSHPLPDQDSVRATEELIEFVDQFTDHDLVVCVISGGASALMVAPIDGVTITDLQRLNRLLLASGMTIHEINLVRKHLDRVKGGGLARMMAPATVVSLIVSDVIGDNLEIIASGPTTPDPSNPDQAIAILKKWRLWDQATENIRAALAHKAKSHDPTAKNAGPGPFRKIQNIIVGANRLSLIAAEQRAKRLGMNVLTLSSSVRGESREIAHFYAALAREIRSSGRPIAPPACLVAGGETTVTVKGSGRGGRCQELCLAIALELSDVPGAVFIAAGSDGIDGPTTAAGAIADSLSMTRAKNLGLDPEALLANNDSNRCFDALGDLIVTGPTGANVMDLHLLLVG